MEIIEWFCVKFVNCIVSYRLYVLGYVLAVVIMLLGAFYSAEKVKSTMQHNNIVRLTNLLINALSTIEYFEEQENLGKMDEQAAKKYAAQILQSYSYSQDEYIYGLQTKVWNLLRLHLIHKY